MSDYQSAQRTLVASATRNFLMMLLLTLAIALPVVASSVTRFATPSLTFL